MRRGRLEALGLGELAGLPGLVALAGQAGRAPQVIGPRRLGTQAGRLVEDAQAALGLDDSGPRRATAARRPRPGSGEARSIPRRSRSAPAAQRRGQRPTGVQASPGPASAKTPSASRAAARVACRFAGRSSPVNWVSWKKASLRRWRKRSRRGGPRAGAPRPGFRARPARAGRRPGRAGSSSRGSGFRTVSRWVRISLASVHFFSATSAWAWKSS